MDEEQIGLVATLVVFLLILATLLFGICYCKKLDIELEKYKVEKGVYNTIEIENGVDK